MSIYIQSPQMNKKNFKNYRKFSQEAILNWLPVKMFWNLNDFPKKIDLINWFVDNFFRLLLQSFIRKTLVAKQTMNFY